MKYMKHILPSPNPPQPRYKIAILGYEKAGKQSLLRGLTEKGAPIYTHRNTSCRLPDLVKVHIAHNARLNIEFVVSDIGYYEPRGWKRFRRGFYRDADAVIWVIGTDARNDVFESSDWIQYELKIGSDERNGEGEQAQDKPVCPGLDTVPWLILFNKRDLEDACSLETILGDLRLDELGLEKNSKFFETSVLKWEGVDEGVEWLIGKLRGEVR